MYKSKINVDVLTKIDSTYNHNVKIHEKNLSMSIHDVLNKNIHSCFMSWFDNTLINEGKVKSSDLIPICNFNIDNLYESSNKFFESYSLFNSEHIKIKQLIHYQEKHNTNQWQYGKFKIQNIITFETYDNPLICIVMNDLQNKNMCYCFVDKSFLGWDDINQEIINYVGSHIYVVYDNEHNSLIMINNMIIHGYFEINYGNININVNRLNHIVDDIKTIHFSFDIKEIISKNQNIMYGVILLYILNYIYCSWIYIHLVLINKLQSQSSQSPHTIEFMNNIINVEFDTMSHNNKSILNSFIAKIFSCVELRDEIYKILNDSAFDGYILPFNLLVEKINDTNIKSRFSRKFLLQFFDSPNPNFMNINNILQENDFLFPDFELDMSTINIYIQELINNELSNELTVFKDNLLLMMSLKIVSKMVHNSSEFEIKNKKLEKQLLKYIHQFDTCVKLYYLKRRELRKIINSFQEFQNSEDKTKPIKKDMYMYYYIIIKYTFEYTWKYNQYSVNVRANLENNNDFWKFINTSDLLEVRNYKTQCKLFDNYDSENFMIPTYRLLNVIKDTLKTEINLSNIVPLMPIYSIPIKNMFNKLIDCHQELSLKESIGSGNIQIFKQNILQLTNFSTYLSKYIESYNRILKYNLSLFVSQYITIDKLIRTFYNPDVIVELKKIEDNLIDETYKMFYKWTESYIGLMIVYNIYENEISMEDFAPFKEQFDKNSTFIKNMTMVKKLFLPLFNDNGDDGSKDG